MENNGRIGDDNNMNTIDNDPFNVGTDNMMEEDEGRQEESVVVLDEVVINKSMPFSWISPSTLHSCNWDLFWEYKIVSAEDVVSFNEKSILPWHLLHYDLKGLSDMGCGFITMRGLAEWQKHWVNKYEKKSIMKRNLRAEGYVKDNVRVPRDIPVYNRRVYKTYNSWSKEYGQCLQMTHGDPKYWFRFLPKGLQSVDFKKVERSDLRSNEEWAVARKILRLIVNKNDDLIYRFRAFMDTKQLSGMPMGDYIDKFQTNYTNIEEDLPDEIMAYIFLSRLNKTAISLVKMYLVGKSGKEYKVEYPKSMKDAISLVSIVCGTEVTPLSSGTTMLRRVYTDATENCVYDDNDNRTNNYRGNYNNSSYRGNNYNSNYRGNYNNNRGYNNNNNNRTWRGGFNRRSGTQPKLSEQERTSYDNFQRWQKWDKDGSKTSNDNNETKPEVDVIESTEVVNNLTKTPKTSNQSSNDNNNNNSGIYNARSVNIRRIKVSNDSENEDIDEMDESGFPMKRAFRIVLKFAKFPNKVSACPTYCLRALKEELENLDKNSDIPIALTIDSKTEVWGIVDSGACVSFMSTLFARANDITVIDCNAVEVHLAKEGEIASINKITKMVDISFWKDGRIQSFHGKFYVMPLCSCDCIIGTDMFKKIGISVHGVPSRHISQSPTMIARQMRDSCYGTSGHGSAPSWFAK